MSKPVIEVENLSKLYHLGLIGSTTLRESFEKWCYRRLSKEAAFKKHGTRKLMISSDDYQAGVESNAIWALKDVSFSVKQGDVLGIIGKNGSGKSTLLKILSRITEPTKGQAVIRGRTSSLLEVGTGFHPELTGRENIYLNGAILGMRKNEIRLKFDEIVAFAEIERFIDTPVKRYSSGMYVRLAFAVAAHLEPEILFIDEVLAVGDLAFQKKCLGKMSDVAKLGRTVLFVSHNMAAVSQLCMKALWLHNGKLYDCNAVDDVVGKYIQSFTISGSAHKKINISKDMTTKDIFFEEISIMNSENIVSSVIDIRQNFYISLAYVVKKTLQIAELSIRIIRSDGVAVFTTNQSDFSPESFSRAPGSYRVKIVVPAMFLMPGQYHLNIAAHIPMIKFYDYHEEIVGFNIIDSGTRFARYNNLKILGVIVANLLWHEQKID